MNGLYRDRSSGKVIALCYLHWLKLKNVAYDLDERTRRQCSECKAEREEIERENDETFCRSFVASLFEMGEN
jgi:hypothetical protein